MGTASGETAQIKPDSLNSATLYLFCHRLAAAGGRAGQGRAGQGRAGQGRAGQA